MPRATGRGPTNLLSRTKTPRARGRTPTSIAKKAIRKTRPTGMVGQASLFATTIRCGMAQHRERFAGIEPVALSWDCEAASARAAIACPAPQVSFKGPAVASLISQPPCQLRTNPGRRFLVRVHCEGYIVKEPALVMGDNQNSRPTTVRIPDQR